MRFVDEIVIRVTGGNGGKGSASFRREKYVPRGGPDGGNGGNGGNVYLRASDAINHLGEFVYRPLFEGESGEAGRGRGANGADGENRYIDVPLGTVVYDAETKELIGELVAGGESLLVANGGRRGYGNLHYKSSTNRAPRRTTPGTKGESRQLFLELRILADVGLIGRPNVGKSSLLNALTGAKSKVGDFIFTTLYPALGAIHRDYDPDFLGYTLADIPGLIAGAHKGEGLGFQFLRHIKRTHLLLHLVDISGSEIVSEIEEVENNLFSYNSELREHPRWLALNKCDKVSSAHLSRVLRQIKKRYSHPCYIISTLDKTGLPELCSDIARFISPIKKDGKNE